ncbi:MAG: AmmeMemoRadiSam system protein B [Thermoguttaceae bacterium]|nr:AmmeMemoRadiSam system protein B [Thermoguttaceae bacterium]
MSQEKNERTSSSPKPDFSPEVMERLFYWARDRVFGIVSKTPSPEVSELGDIGKTSVLGAFVSFKKRGRLRSCMGYMSEGVALGLALGSAARSATLDDPRFPPISGDELYDLDLEVWALGAMREMEERGESRLGAVNVGRDGLQIQGRGRRGLLLPSVPIEMNWDAKRFLDGLCDKAGLPRGAWKDDDVKLFVFEGVSFKKPFVWNVSKNPSLAKFISENARGEGTSSERWGGGAANRPSFSIAPELFRWSVPSLAPRAGAEIDDSRRTRRPAVAGAFYPASAREQNAMLERFDLENRVGDLAKSRVSGAMVPHAGWIYSGRLAAKTLASIEPPETVFVFAPKHRREGANFAVMPYGSWDFGAGRIESDSSLIEEFVRAVPSFHKDATAHRSEHSIEVTLPMLARYFPGVKVVGALIGASSKRELATLSDQFAAFLLERRERGLKDPLLLVSSDMNHYASEATTRIVDKMALDALETTNPEELYDVVRREGITMCGVLPAFFVLSTLKKLGEFNRATQIGRATSGESSGDYDRVVGYAGYVFN